MSFQVPEIKASVSGLYFEYVTNIPNHIVSKNTTMPISWPNSSDTVKHELHPLPLMLSHKLGQKWFYNDAFRVYSLCLAILIYFQSAGNRKLMLPTICTRCAQICSAGRSVFRIQRHRRIPKNLRWAAVIYCCKFIQQRRILIIFTKGSNASSSSGTFSTSTGMGSISSSTRRFVTICAVAFILTPNRWVLIIPSLMSYKKCFTMVVTLPFSLQWESNLWIYRPMHFATFLQMAAWTCLRR